MLTKLHMITSFSTLPLVLLFAFW